MLTRRPLSSPLASSLALTAETCPPAQPYGGRRRWRGVLTALCALTALTACDIDLGEVAPPAVQGPLPEPDATPQKPDTPPDEHPHPPTDGPQLGECESSPAWFTETFSLYLLEGSFLGITPNDGLVVVSDLLGGGGGMVRTGDGEIVAQGGLDRLITIDEGWTYRLTLNDTWNGVDVRNLITDEMVLSLPSPFEYSEQYTGALSPAGDRVAALFCMAGVTHLVVRDIGADPDAAPVFAGDVHTSADEQCAWWGSPSPYIHFLPQGDAVVLALPRHGEVHTVDLTTGEKSTVVAHVMPEGFPEEELQWTADGPLLGFALSADGSQVATTGFEGKLRRFKLPGLVEIDDGVDAGMVQVNLSVYAPPRTVSPVAFSPDGKSLLQLGPDGHPVLRDLDTGAVLAVLAAPAPPDESEIWTSEEYQRAVAMAFSPTGSSVAIAFGGGIGLWRCAGTGPVATHPLSVILEGPHAGAVGEEMLFVATHLGSDAFHAHSFYVDGELLWGAGGLGRTGSVTLYEPGTYEISVVVDDGASTGTASMSVTVE